MISKLIGLVLTVCTGGLWPVARGFWSAIKWLFRCVKSKEGQPSRFDRILTYVIGHTIFSILFGSVSLWGVFKVFTYVLAGVLRAGGWSTTPPEEDKSFIARAKEAVDDRYEKLKEKMAAEIEERKKAAEEVAAKLKVEHQRAMEEAQVKFKREKEEHELSLKRVIEERELADKMAKIKREAEEEAAKLRLAASVQAAKQKEESEKLRRAIEDRAAKQKEEFERQKAEVLRQQSEMAAKAREAVEKAKDELSLVNVLGSALSHLTGQAMKETGWTLECLSCGKRTLFKPPFGNENTYCSCGRGHGRLQILAAFKPIRKGQFLNVACPIDGKEYVIVGTDDPNIRTDLARCPECNLQIYSAFAHEQFELQSKSRKPEGPTIAR